MPKIAIICDWLTNYGGAERVIEALSDMFPDAPIYTSIFNEKKMPSFSNKKIITSFIQNLPFAKKNHRPYLKLMPYAFEQFDLSQFDIVLSSSHSCAKGVITKPETLHICYCHSPMRYAWDDFHSYIAKQRVHRSLKNWIYYLISDLRLWDRLSADRVDYFVTNSNFVNKRIQKYYHRDSKVIYPPCNIERFKLSKNEGKYYLALGRIIPYKRFDLIVSAFNELGLPLKIVGEGNELKYLKKAAKGNIEFLGHVEEKQLPMLYANSKALIFPQSEDFGITPIESQASGRPVICYADGGALETVIDEKTGVYFNKQNKEELINAVRKFEKMNFDANFIRKHAEKFGHQVFEKNLSKFIEEKWNTWNQ